MCPTPVSEGRCGRIGVRNIAQSSTLVQVYLVLLPFSECDFDKLKICANHVSRKSIGATSVCSLRVSVSHLLILAIFKTFLILLYLTVICDRWYYYCNCFRRHKRRPCKTAILTRQMLCVFCFTERPFPGLSSSPRSPYSLRHNNVEIMTVNNPRLAFLNVQVKGRVTLLSL
jgi:hypothetical protein